MKNILEIEIGEVWVEGEISNLRRQASGHCYFTLKDAGAQISCVLFRGSAVRAKAQPEDGMQVRLFAEVSLYETRGQLQLIVKQVEDAGLGDLQAKFEALKRKLDKEGLFDSTYKKPLPKFPQSIGIITSGTGAALQDMLNILTRRAPWVQPILYPVTVQGAGAEVGIARAIDELADPQAHGLPSVDVIIIGRGGGSLEDLWNFNEEIVARSIYACPIPLVSAVGHEIDFTISDFVADMRAPTPSAAAELVVPDADELRGKVRGLSEAMKRTMENRLRHDDAILHSAKRALMPKDAERALRDPIQELDLRRQELTDAAGYHLDTLQAQLRELSLSHKANHPAVLMEKRAERLVDLKARMGKSAEVNISQANNKLGNLQSLVRTMGLESTFKRGFSITMDSKGGIVRSVAGMKSGDVLVSKLADGSVSSVVEKNTLPNI